MSYCWKRNNEVGSVSDEIVDIASSSSLVGNFEGT